MNNSISLKKTTSKSFNNKKETTSPLYPHNQTYYSTQANKYY